MNIVCLDIDGCILPSSFITSQLESKDTALKTLAINIDRLVMFLKAYDCKLFLTSSWSKMFTFENNSLQLKKIVYDNIVEKQDVFMKTAIDLIINELSHFLIGISCGDRDKDIILLSENKDNRVVVFDDWDLSHLNSDNVKSFLVFDFLSNFILLHASNFLRR